MNKYANGFLLFVVSLFLSLCLARSIEAEEYSFDGFSDNWDELFEELPEEIREELTELDKNNLSQSAERLAKKLDFSYWIKKIFNALRQNFFPSLRAASSICGILILIATINLLSENVTNSSFHSIFELCSDLCMTSMILEVVNEIMERSSAYLEQLCGIMNVMIPVTEAIYLTEGAVSQLAVHKTALLLYIAITSNLNNLILKPAFGVLFGFLLIAAVFREFNPEGFINGIRKFITTTFALFALVFSFILGLQTMLAKSADSLGIKAMRFALSNFIPIVGGTLSEALTTLREGINVIKSVTGISGIIIILLLVLPVSASMFCNNVLLSFCHMTAEILGCSKSAKIINEIKSVLSILGAVVYSTSLLFIMAMILFAKVGGQ